MMKQKILEIQISIDTHVKKGEGSYLERELLITYPSEAEAVFLAVLQNACARGGELTDLEASSHHDKFSLYSRKLKEPVSGIRIVAWGEEPFTKKSKALNNRLDTLTTEISDSFKSIGWTVKGNDAKNYLPEYLAPTGIPQHISPTLEDY